MRDFRQTMLLLPLGLMFMAGGFLLVSGLAKDEGKQGAGRPRQCSELGSCVPSHLGLDPDKARRFADVFRS
jgi:hypothetical protein